MLTFCSLATSILHNKAEAFPKRHLLILFTLRYAAESSKQYLLEKL